MKYRNIYTAALFSIFQFSILHSFSQPLNSKKTFTRADTLRGSNGPGRNWWDVQRYDIDVTFDITKRAISGKCVIKFKVLKPGTVMQVDLQSPLILDSAICFITSHKVNLSSNSFSKSGNVYFINIPNLGTAVPNLADENYLTIYYHGTPQIAANPPWDGGLVWETDEKNNPFVSIACQGKGASVWYPCKDIQSDEPDNGASVTMTYPDTLVGVANGRNIFTKKNNDGTTTSKWEVKAPINNYCIIPYIGKYVHFGETYKGLNGNLDLDYWVLEQNLEKAKKQFAQVPKMMEAFEFWFGPYPFYEDGYKLVEAPYLGMEHQSATAYGNKYLNGYLGFDMSGSGWGNEWDYIIVHESGHEWFANNITTNDIADMWVHEGFTNYSEVLYVDYYNGKEAGDAYNAGIRMGIENKEPVIGPYGVNKEGSGDMYPKGANLIHTIRQIIGNEVTFRNILTGLNKDFYHKTTTSAEVEKYISAKAGIDFSKVFDQYLRNTKIPVLEYKINKGKIMYRWTNCIKGFNMPVKILLDKLYDKSETIKATDVWQTMPFPKGYDGKTFEVNRNFYVFSRLLKN